MERIESKGFYPNEEIAKKICSKRLELWEKIGETVVCDEDVDTTAAIEMFTEDSISHKLISTLAQYNPDAKKILIKQNHQSGCANAQSYNKFQDDLREAIEPRCVMQTDSNFMAIVSQGQNEDTVLLGMWDLRICY